MNYYTEESSTAPQTNRYQAGTSSDREIISLLTSINYGLMELNSRVRTIENMLGLDKYNKDTAEKLDKILVACHGNNEVKE